MEIIKKDIEGLKQLDRIEYRGRYKYSFTSKVDWVTHSIFIILFGDLLLNFYEYNIVEGYACLFAVVSIYVLAGITVNCIQNIIQKENFKELNKKYFKVVKKLVGK